MTTVTVSDTTQTIVVTESPGTTAIVTAPSPTITVQSLEVGPQGPGGVLPMYGSFIDTTTQPLVSTGASQAIGINTTLENRGVTISNTSRINFQYAGTYRIFASIQLTNTTNNVAEINIYFKQNNVTIPNSNTRIDLPQRKSASVPFHGCFSIELQLTVAASSYIELHWVADHLGVNAETIAADATHPQAPSVILNVAQVITSST